MGALVGPFAQQGLDDTFGLAVGLRSVGPGAEMPHLVVPVGLLEDARDVTAAVVGHDPLNRDVLTAAPA